MWSADPALIGDIDRTEQILVQTARPFTGTLSSPLSTEDAQTIAGIFGQNSPITQVVTGENNPNACIVRDNSAAVPNNIAGYGIIDAYAAVKEALAEKSASTQ